MLEISQPQHFLAAQIRQSFWSFSGLDTVFFRLLVAAKISVMLDFTLIFFLKAYGSCGLHLSSQTPLQT